MKVLWTLLKIVLALAIVIPVSLVVLGIVAGLAALTFRVAVMVLLGYGAFKLVARLLRRPKPGPSLKQLRPGDPYYTAAMRELDLELGEPTHR
jgi:hypothetical protein